MVVNQSSAKSNLWSAVRKQSVASSSGSVSQIKAIQRRSGGGGGSSGGQQTTISEEEAQRLDEIERQRQEEARQAKQEAELKKIEQQQQQKEAAFLAEQQSQDSQRVSFVGLPTVARLRREAEAAEYTKVVGEFNALTPQQAEAKALAGEPGYLGISTEQGTEIMYDPTSRVKVAGEEFERQITKEPIGFKGVGGSILFSALTGGGIKGVKEATVFEAAKMGSDVVGASRFVVGGVSTGVDIALTKFGFQQVGVEEIKPSRNLPLLGTAVQTLEKEPFDIRQMKTELSLTGLSIGLGITTAIPAAGATVGGVQLTRTQRILEGAKYLTPGITTRRSGLFVPEFKPTEGTIPFREQTTGTIVSYTPGRTSAESLTAAYVPTKTVGGETTFVGKAKLQAEGYVLTPGNLVKVPVETTFPIAARSKPEGTFIQYPKADIEFPKPTGFVSETYTPFGKTEEAGFSAKISDKTFFGATGRPKVYLRETEVVAPFSSIPGQIEFLPVLKPTYAFKPTSKFAGFEVKPKTATDIGFSIIRGGGKGTKLKPTLSQQQETFIKLPPPAVPKFTTPTTLTSAPTTTLLTGLGVGKEFGGLRYTPSSYSGGQAAQIISPALTGATILTPPKPARLNVVGDLEIVKTGFITDITPKVGIGVKDVTKTKTTPIFAETQFQAPFTDVTPITTTITTPTLKTQTLLRTPQITEQIMPRQTLGFKLGVGKFDFGRGIPLGLGIPGLGFPDEKKGRITKGRKFKRQISLASYELGLKGTIMPGLEKTGLFERPLPLKKPKKRRKK